MAQALSAICLLVNFMVVAYEFLVIQPFGNRTFLPTTQYLRTHEAEVLFLTDWPWTVKVVGVFIPTPDDLRHLIC